MSQENLDLYTIESINFEIPFVGEPINYKRGEQVNRANFTSFITKSFALSQGNSSAQVTVLEWFKHNSGFDYSEAIKNFGKAGGLNSLSDEEKQNFINSYINTPQHGAENSTAESHGQLILDHIKDELGGVISSDPKIRSINFMKDKNFKKMTWEDFLLKLNKKINSTRYN